MHNQRQNSLKPFYGSFWKMAKHSSKILQCSHSKISKVGLFFNIMHERINKIINIHMPKNFFHAAVAQA